MPTEYTIPFNRVAVLGRELEYIEQVLESGQIAGDGYFTHLCEALLRDRLNAERVLITSSCTHALELAALLLDIGPGDEVIMPSFTFVSTANAFVLRGAIPRFVDVRPDTLNLDQDLVADAITDRTRCIVPVHYGGVACEMNVLGRLASSNGVAIVEDNAHGLFGAYEGQPLGTFGCLATQSFHATKNFSSGEGGALVINDSELVDRAEVLREKGTNRRQFILGQADKYTWVDCGSSYVASELLAAFLFGQLECAERTQSVRSRIWSRYQHELSEWAASQGIQQPYVPDRCDQAFHLYYLLLPNKDSRDALIEHLRRHKILAVFHYVPLHSSPMGIRLGVDNEACPVTESVSQRLVRLPLYTSLTSEEQDKIIDVLHHFAV